MNTIAYDIVDVACYFCLVLLVLFLQGAGGRKSFLQGALRAYQMILQYPHGQFMAAIIVKT